MKDGEYPLLHLGKAYSAIRKYILLLGGPKTEAESNRHIVCHLSSLSLIKKRFTLTRTKRLFMRHHTPTISLRRRVGKPGARLLKRMYQHALRFSGPSGAAGGMADEGGRARHDVGSSAGVVHQQQRRHSKWCSFHEPAVWSQQRTLPLRGHAPGTRRPMRRTAFDATRTVTLSWTATPTSKARKGWLARWAWHRSVCAASAWGTLT